MTALMTPNLEWYDAWAAMVTEFGPEYPHGSGADPEGQAVDRAAFEDFVAKTVRYADTSAALPEGKVHCDYFWVTERCAGAPAELVGFLALRHRLNDFLIDTGGHIGYSIRPSRRRLGHASRALAAALPRACDLGLDRVLITCQLDNAASRAVIERAGGVFEDVRGDQRRYWVTL